MQNRVLPVVGEIHILQDDVALETLIRHAAVGLDLLPGPLLGAFFALLDLTVPFPTAHECHRALVRLRLLIHQREDTTRTRETHDDRVDLLRDTADLTGELPLHVEERHGDADAEGHTAQAQVRHLQEEQHAAVERQHDIKHVSDIAEDRHQGIRVAVRLLRHREKLVVDLVEIALRRILVVEDLDDLLTVHHLLDEALGLCNRRLLLHEVASGAAADLLHDLRHDDDAADHEDREPHTVVQHERENGDEDDARVQELRDRL